MGQRAPVDARGGEGWSDPWAVVTAPDGRGIGRRSGRFVAVRLAIAAFVAAGGPTLHLTGRLRPALAAGLAAVAAVASLRLLRPPATAAADRAIWRALRGLGSLVGGIVLFAVAVPLLYLPGLVGRLVDARRRARPAATFWRVHANDLAAHRRDVRRPFSAADPRSRRRSNAFGAASLAALVLVAVVWAVPDVRPGPDVRAAEAAGADVFARARAVRFSDLPAYEGLDWADELKREQDVLSNERLQPSEVGGYQIADFAGRFTTVRDGERLTPGPRTCDCTPKVVWLFGGSAAFGLGQRDDHTIAAELVRRAADDGIALQVRNFGVPGWTMWQEAQQLEAKLATEPHPDLVLFYNGYNGVLGTVISAAVKGIRPDEPALLVGEEILEFSERRLDPSGAGTSEELGDLAVARYRRVARDIEVRLGALGIESLHVFQPDALADPEQYASIEDVYTSSSADRAFLDRTLDHTARTLAEDGVVNLRRVLDGLDTPVFADLVHTNERGAEVVADALHPRLRAALR